MKNGKTEYLGRVLNIGEAKTAKLNIWVICLSILITHLFTGKI